MKLISNRGVVNGLLIIALIILSGCIILGYRQINTLINANQSVLHTHQVLEASNNITLSLSEADNAISDYLSSTGSVLIKTFPNKIAIAKSNLAALKSLTVDNSSQQAKVMDLEKFINEKIILLQQFYADTKHTRYDLAFLSGRQMSVLTETITEKFEKFNQAELNLLSSRNAKVIEQVNRSSIVFLAATSLSVLTLLICFMLLNYILKEHALAERRQAEKEKQLRLVVDATKDYVIAMLDPDGIVTMWNAGGEQITGYSPQEIIGKHFSILYTEEDRARHHPEHELEVAYQKGRYEEEGWRLKKDGTKYRANIVVRPILDEDDHLIGFAKITRDLTESHKISEMKNEFVSVVSHELRTPLTSIRGSLALVNNSNANFPTQVQKLLEIASTNCERLLLLINDILDVEKIEAGKMDFNFKLYDVNKLINEAYEVNKIYADKYNTPVQIELMKNDVQIYVDYSRMMQVLSNLISNAAKFSHPYKTIFLRTVIIGENKVRISVENEGVGISDEFSKHIFEKFSQAESSDTRSKGGTGLGLNISKAIVDRMKGSIGFTSEVNGKTIFYIDMPAVNATDIALPMEEKPFKANKQRRLLICETSVKQAEEVSKLLKTGGFEVDIATSILQAKRLMQENEYNALMLNVLFTNEEGIKFIRELRQQNATTDLPIIITSLIGESDSKSLSGDAFSLHDWLDQPIDKINILNTLTNLKTSSQDLPKILHVEDDADTRHIIETLIDGKADVTGVPTLREAREVLAKEKFNLVILDLLLPDGNGAELLPSLSINNIPVMIYSAWELDKSFSHYVTQAVVKSKITHTELLNRVKGILEKVD